MSKENDHGLFTLGSQTGEVEVNAEMILGINWYVNTSPSGATSWSNGGHFGGRILVNGTVADESKTAVIIAPGLNATEQITVREVHLVPGDTFRFQLFSSTGFSYQKNFATLEPRVIV